MSEQTQNSGKKIISLILAGLFVIVVIAIAYYRFRPELMALWSAIKSEESHPGFLLGSFIILPIFGFPVSPFLILLGLRFGDIAGILFMMVIMPVHLTISYWVTRSLLRDRVEALAKKNNLNITGISENRRMTFGLVFMIVPGLSYTMKNYLLPLSGMSFLQFLLCAWLIQGIMGIPFVVLGNSAAELSIPLFLGVLGLIVLIIIFRKWMLKKYNRFIKSVLNE